MGYIHDTLYVINGKWKLLVLATMHMGVHRFKELQRSVPGITAKALSNTLKDLELNNLITRTVHNTMPVLIEYHLTEHAMTLEPIIFEMIDWGKEHRQKLIKEG